MSETGRIRIGYAESLGEVYQRINDIKELIVKEGENTSPLLWFRGHASSSYNLQPSIFRGTGYEYNTNKTYSNNHLREDYRFQSFMARNYANVGAHMPQTVIEWQEVMQHFFTKTRLMDWSESLIVALEFALEAFITPNADLEIKERRRTASPVIWVLEPAALNKEVYHTFADVDSSLIKNAIDKKKMPWGMAERISRELMKEEKRGIYFNIKSENEKNMNAMISLSSLEIIRNAYKGREAEALSTFEMNPFFYLLLRYYSDGLPVELGKLPPLAIIHPYHSERIKMQKGVFTVFPYYILNKEMESVKALTGKYPPLAMEYMRQCKPYLYKIEITNPQKVAQELLLTGAKRGNLYPDMQVISLDMENVVESH